MVPIHINAVQHVFGKRMCSTLMWLQRDFCPIDLNGNAPKMHVKCM